MWLTCMFVCMMISNDLIKFVIESITIWFMLFTLKWLTLTLTLTFSFDSALYTLYYFSCSYIGSFINLIGKNDKSKWNQIECMFHYIILFPFFFLFFIFLFLFFFDDIFSVRIYSSFFSFIYLLVFFFC